MRVLRRTYTHLMVLSATSLVFWYSLVVFFVVVYESVFQSTLRVHMRACVSLCACQSISSFFLFYWKLKIGFWAKSRPATVHGMTWLGMALRLPSSFQFSFDPRLVTLRMFAFNNLQKLDEVFLVLVLSVHVDVSLFLSRTLASLGH